MHLLVTKIEFDFDEYGDGNPEWQLSQEEQNFITDNALGLWDVESEDELIEKSKLNKILFKGKLKFNNYERYMVIGLF